MPIDATSGMQNNGAVGSTSKAATQAMNGVLGKDDFMKMFLASLKFQDPMSPMETKDMMAQMSQLTMVESVANLSDVVADLKSVVNGSPLEKGMDFLGKTVSGVSVSGEMVKGEVTEISNYNDMLELMVGNKRVDVSSINNVAMNSAYNKF